MNESPIHIITPSYQRHAFIPKLAQMIQKQRDDHWRWYLVSDGPDKTAEALLKNVAGEDPRISFLFTESRTNDWGGSPRILAMDHIQREFGPDSFAYFLDDDNYLYPDAVGNMRRELQGFNPTDLMLVRIQSKDCVQPVDDKDIEALQRTEVDTGCFCVKVAAGLRHYPTVVAEKFGQGEDYRFFELIRQDESLKVVKAGCPPVAQKDGLFLTTTIRRILHLPHLDLGRKGSWLRPLVQWLKKRHETFTR